MLSVKVCIDQLKFREPKNRSQSKLLISCSEIKGPLYHLIKIFISLNPSSFTHNLVKPEQLKQIIWYLKIIWEFSLTFHTNTIIFKKIEKEEKNGKK